MPEIAGGSAAAAREAAEQWQNFQSGQYRGWTDGCDELGAAGYPEVPRRFQPQGRTIDFGVDLPCRRDVRKKRKYLAPRCLIHHETGPTKMCDGCELSLSLNIISAAFAHCVCRSRPRALSRLRPRRGNLVLSIGTGLPRYSSLMEETVYQPLTKAARAVAFDVIHSGVPCSTWPAARHLELGGGGSGSCGS